MGSHFPRPLLFFLLTAWLNLAEARSGPGLWAMGPTGCPGAGRGWRPGCTWEQGPLCSPGEGLPPCSSALSGGGHRSPSYRCGEAGVRAGERG